MRPIATSRRSAMSAAYKPSGRPIGAGRPHEACTLEAADPTQEAAALNKALEERLRTLPERDLRRVALMKLEGYTNQEIAESLKRSMRGVERKLGIIRRRWEAAVEDLA